VGPSLAEGPRIVTEKNGVPAKDDSGRNYSFPWVYMGPGICYNPRTHRVHIRLTPTMNNLSGVEDYDGPTDPNELPLVVCDENETTLTVADSQYLVFQNLTVRFGGHDTIGVGDCESVLFENIGLLTATNAVRFGQFAGVTFRNCRFDGGLPPWFFRSDRKEGYHYQLSEDGPVFENTLGKGTVGVFMYGLGAMKELEVDHCEFVNGHDLYLRAASTHFHHNWIDNLDDEALLLDADPQAGGCIHSNVITRCLTAISMAVNLTADHWYIYRNLIDLRAPTLKIRPRPGDETNVWGYGAAFKSNDAPATPDGPYDVFHNTFLVANQPPRAAYTHYRSAVSPHLRRSFNNIFVAVNAAEDTETAIAFVPPPSFPGSTDGNLYHRIGGSNAHPLRSIEYTFEGVQYSGRTYTSIKDLSMSALFCQSKTQYPPGYEASSRIADPLFRRIAADGIPDTDDDLRPEDGSPACQVGVSLPPDLQALDNGIDPTANEPILHAGCYRCGDVPPLRVGVNGRRRFPNPSPPP
jgi:hypothetical protein